MRSFAEDGSHAPPGASHNMPFCSTGGTRQRPRRRSGGRRPAAKRGRSRKGPRRYRFQGGPFRLRPRPPLLVLVAAPLGFRPPPGASPLVAPSRAALQAAPTPALRGTAAVKPGFRLQVFAGIPASPLAVLIGGRVSLATHRHAAASGLRSGKHRAGKAVTLLADRFARRRRELRAVFAFEARKEVGASKTNLSFSVAWRRENDAPRSPRTGDHEAAQVLTWGEIAGFPITGNRAWPGFQSLDNYVTARGRRRLPAVR